MYLMSTYLMSKEDKNHSYIVRIFIETLYMTSLHSVFVPYFTS